MPRLTSNAKPLSPYRVLWDLMHTVDVSRTIITHDAGSPRDQISPFWEPVAPLTYIGWGKTTQLGDRKSTRLNSSHTVISYAVFCLKKKIETTTTHTFRDTHTR